MGRNAAVYLIFMIGSVVAAETIGLTGTVSNLGGVPVKGAVVTLLGKKLADTTDANGAYSISAGISAVKAASIQPGAEKILINSGAISLCLTNTAPVKIEMFDMQGNLLQRVVDNPTAAGDYRFDLMTQRFAASVMIVRVTVGRNVSSFRYLPLHDGRSSFSTSAAVSTDAGGLALVPAIVDTLKVTASGYIPKNVTITSYETSVNIGLDSVTLDKFSFFVTSLKALQELSGNANGFGGNLSFGKTGAGAGLRGADSICQCIAERSMPGSKVKQWRAFLSVASDENGKQVNAIDRIGTGPWYDRIGRLLAPTLADLKNTRPMNGDATIKNDLPNEDGVPNHRPDPAKAQVDNHHMLTGSNTDGTLYTGKTCKDWTSVSTSDKARCGFAWPRGGMGKTEAVSGSSGSHWLSGFDTPGCAVGIQITNEMGGSGGIIGGGGGYGGFYCFALTE